MIFYFTGTGNSLWVAKALSEALGEPLVSIADELHKEKDGWVYPVRPDEKILFVYPVHSWGPAVSVSVPPHLCRLHRNQAARYSCSA